MDSEEIKQEAQKENLEDIGSMSFGEVVRFLLFGLTFVVAVLNQLQVEKTFYITEGITLAVSGDNFDEISNKDQTVEWILEDFIPVMTDKQYYSEYNSLPEDYQKLAFFNKVISPIRFFQKRIETEENPFERAKKVFPERWAEKSLDLYKANQKGESKKSYGPSSENPEKNYMFVYNEQAGIKEVGGFQLVIESAADSKTTSERVLKNNSWVDEYTAAMEIDFVSYNGHYDMLSYVSVVFEFLESGIVNPDIKIRSIRAEFYRETIDFVRLFFEIAYILLVIFYSFIEFFELKTDFGYGLDELRRNEVNRYLILPLSLYMGLKKHFSDFWNILDALSLGVSYVCVILWFIIAFDIIEESEFDLETMNRLQGIINQLNTYIFLTSLNFLLIFFRMIKYLGRFERVRLLQKTFQNAQSEIFYFFILLISIFFAFVIHGHLAFGSFSEEFASVSSAVSSCFIVLLADLGIILDLLSLSFLKAAVFLILFTLFINFILANMFIAIIGSAYGQELENLEERKEQLKGLNSKTQKHITYRVLDSVKGTWHKLRSVFSKKKAIISKYKHHEIESAVVVDDEIKKVENHDIEYQQVKRWGGKIDTEVLTDKEKYLKLTQSTTDLSKRLWSAVIFLVFAIVYVCVIVFQQEIETKYSLSRTMKNAIGGSLYENKYTLDDVNSFSGIEKWMKEAVPGFIESSPYHQISMNYLVGQDLDSQTECSKEGPLRMTIRKVDYRVNPNEYFEDVIYYSRKENFSPFDGQEKDYKAFYNLSCKWTYQDQGGFMDKGGYVFYLSSNEKDYENQINTLFQDKFLNESINSMVLDFVVYQPDINYFTYVALLTEFASGGSIGVSYYIYPMKFKLYHEVSDIIRAFFEFVFIVLLVYHMAITFKHIYLEYRGYETWKSRFFEILTKSQKQKRLLTKPEWLRKMSNIFTVTILIELGLYLCSIVCIAYWISYLTNEVTGLELKVREKNFQTLFSIQASTSEAYMYWSSVNILLMFIRLIGHLTINKELSFLQDTLRVSVEDISYFLLMLLVLLFGFTFMAYLSFGHTLGHYKTIGNSLTTCFNMIIGNFDYEEIGEADKVMRIIFFFTFMVFFTFILLNIFIAILERAYTKVKETMGDEMERKNYLEALFVFLVKKIQGISKDENSFEEEDKKEIAQAVFNRLEVGTQEGEDPKTWGLRVSEEVLLERSKRNILKNQLDSVFKRRMQKEIERGVPSTENPKKLIKEFKARLDYWDYLRLANLTYKSHEQKIKRKTEQVVQQNFKVYEEFKVLEQSKDQKLYEVAPLEQELEFLKSQNQELLAHVKKLEEDLNN